MQAFLYSSFKIFLLDLSFILGRQSASGWGRRGGPGISSNSS